MNWIISTFCAWKCSNFTRLPGLILSKLFLAGVEKSGDKGKYPYAKEKQERHFKETF